MIARSAARVALLWLALACLGGSVRAGEARIADLEVAPAGGGFEVSYRLEGALDDPVVERLQAGMPVTYRHRVQWLSRRGFLLLPDREQGEVVTDVTATYDSLTRTYALRRVRTFRSRGSDSPPPPLEDQATTDSLDEVRHWMTLVDAVRVPAPVRPAGGERQVLRVSAMFGRRMVLGMFPARRSVSLERDLEP